MHLKSLEMSGFKSFADKTKLGFEPGMTAIVGPNGCGKSNVSDAIRWVLGEQSAKALRGAKMQDCIFNGTQNRKPMSMAEVSITFTDCEKVLNTDFHEVTITRRVFRSGEGQYFINKTACRLKDVQRLFMDTGIGTSSYSFMAQGRIDQILSARPEDRRSIFEEASGITKFKSDKKEALRKLDHTEANLIRLADVIREVKRQIGSLQRQAGKAQRYKSLKQKMREYDLFAAQCRLKDFEQKRVTLQSQFDALSAQVRQLHETVDAAEHQNTEKREAIMSMEQSISKAVETALQAQSRLDRTQDMIRMNRQRVSEYQQLADRDTREVDELNRQLEQRKHNLSEVNENLATYSEQRDATQQALNQHQAQYDQHVEAMTLTRRNVQHLRGEIMRLEAEASQIHNRLMQIDQQERSTIIQRERLTAEKQQYTKITEDFSQRLQAEQSETLNFKSQVEAHLQELKTLETQKSEVNQLIASMQHDRAELQSQRAAAEAKVELLSDTAESQEEFPGGARLLLADDNPLSIETQQILGPLVQMIETPDHLTRAVETALRASLDAIVVDQPSSAIHIIKQIALESQGAARLLPSDIIHKALPPIPANMQSLASLIGASNDACRGLIDHLLGNTLFFDSMHDLPDIAPANFSIVTGDGIIIHPDGSCEYWMPEPGSSNPLRRKQAVDAATQTIASINSRIEEIDSKLSSLRDQTHSIDQKLADQRLATDNIRQQAAQKEGELQMVAREAKSATQRLETVTWELDELNGKGNVWEQDKLDLTQKEKATAEARSTAAEESRQANRELENLESKLNELQTQLTERRVAFSSVNQRVEQMKHQHESISSRIEEIELALSGRQDGITTYSQNIEKLTNSINEATEQLATLEEAVSSANDEAQRLRNVRAEMSKTLADAERLLTRSRQELESEQEKKSATDVQLTEIRMRKQNLCDRISADYQLGLHEIMEAPEPEWDNEPLQLDQIETYVAEYRTKLDAMGPVNLVAIEEYQEHEERYTFLSQQEADLQKAKQQLTEMIHKINETTSEMFKDTFEQANANFEKMFASLFNGGSAKLVLVNEEDVLECGIEIIARPPGKRLQNITLLSGGERTLTAVALLFSIYQIKPSPFCMLDELDAPLDDTNIGRFTDVLRQFLEHSQFVVITHNRQSIAVSDVIYGVTMPERGVSRIMSMKFRDDHGGLLTDEAAEERS